MTRRHQLETTLRALKLSGMLDTLFARRKASGDRCMEALRVTKRRLSDIVYRAMLTDVKAVIPLAAWQRSNGQSHLAHVPQRVRPGW